MSEHLGADSQFEYLLEFLRAATWEDSQRILTRHPKLLNDGSYVALQILLCDPVLTSIVYPDLDSAQRETLLRLHCAILGRCREVGTLRAFSELGATNQEPRRSGSASRQVTGLSGSGVSGVGGATPQVRGVPDLLQHGRGRSSRSHLMLIPLGIVGVELAVIVKRGLNLASHSPNWFDSISAVCSLSVGGLCAVFGLVMISFMWITEYQDRQFGMSVVAVLAPPVGWFVGLFLGGVIVAAIICAVLAFVLWAITLE